jgi:hypothetical protein
MQWIKIICFHGQLFSKDTFYFLPLQQDFFGNVKMDGNVKRVG